MTDKEAINLLLGEVADLKEQLRELDAGEIGRERKALARERNLSRSERETSQNEMAVLADKLNAGRNELDDAVTQAIARMENAKRSATSQLQLAYDRAAETEAMLSEVKTGQEQFNKHRESLLQRQDWVINNMDTKREEIERFSAKDYVDKVMSEREQSGLSQQAKEHLDRGLRLLVSDPTAFAQQLQNPPVEPNNLASENNAV